MYKKFIVTTSINPPTIALKKYAAMEGWTLIVVGDLKTPHAAYQQMNCIYLSPKDQEKKYPKLSKLIGWNCIQRRNVGFVLAYQMGAEIIATIDDDNIPYPGWGENLVVGKTVPTHYYIATTPVADPLSATNHQRLWHRGFPLEYVKTKHTIKNKKMKKLKVLVQADLWNGEADVDAIERVSLKTNGYLVAKTPFSFNKIVPFNSQNTFLAREVMPNYFLFPGIGRMDDIWGAYYLQHQVGKCVAFNKASVFQKRNQHTLSKDIENEMLGYKHSAEFAETCNMKLLPKNAREAFKEYGRLLTET